MATNVDPLVVGRVIGDVIDMFVPTVNMSVYYGSKHVTNGCDIKPSMAATPPRVLISGHPTDLYTLRCVNDKGGKCEIVESIGKMNMKHLYDIMRASHFYDLIVLVMTDPDAPSPSEPSMREWIQWIVTDIPGSTNVAGGKVVLPYAGPRPPVGIHRYILVLFRQKAVMGSLEPPGCRSHFNTRAFAHHFDLGMPVATVYFNAHKEPANRKR